MAFRILAADHTGMTVSDVERSLVFWRDVLGFELSHRAHQKGELAEQITGIPGAEILIAVVKAPGHKIELLEYRALLARKKQNDIQPWRYPIAGAHRCGQESHLHFGGALSTGRLAGLSL